MGLMTRPMKLFIITGSRAEYGILKNLIRELKKDKYFKTDVIVTGMHLSKEFGFTINEILKDKIKVEKKININLNSDKPYGISRSTGTGIIKFSKFFSQRRPDLIILLGDRFEILAACTAAYFHRIPVAHLHGGESTEGLIDEGIRHSITKMSHIHFVSTKKYKKKVIQLGESPKNVHLVGAIGIESIKKNKYLSKNFLEKKLKIKFSKKNILVTFHSVTLENNTSKTQFENLLFSLKKLKNTNIFFTKTNSDTFGRVINRLTDSFVKKNSNCFVFKSLGSQKYLSIVKFVDLVVGNSSSGIIEIPSFKIPTINIGDRQKGRVQASSTINCKPISKDITRSINKAYSPKFKKKLSNLNNPYDNGLTSLKIIKQLKKKNLSTLIKKKLNEI